MVAPTEIDRLFATRRLERFITALIIGLSLFCVAAAAGGALMMEMQRADRSAESKRDDAMNGQMLEMAVLAKQIQLEIVQVQQFLTDVSATRGLNGLDDGWVEAERNAQGFKADVARAHVLAKALNAADLDRALTEVEGAFPSYYATGKAMAHGYVDGGTEAGNALMGDFDKASEQLAGKMDAARSALAALQKSQAARDAQVERRLRGEQTLSMAVAVLFALGACVLGFFAVMLTRARLLRPLSIIGAYMGRLAAGDYDKETPFRDRKDELGAMAQSIAVFRQAALERRQIRLDETNARDAAEAERRAAEQQRAAADAERQTVVEALAAGLGRMAEGDLAAGIGQTFPPAYEKLRVDFNAARSRLSEALTAIAEGAETMRGRSDEIASAADDLSRRTEQQAASLEETAAALEQISTTVEQSSRGAREAAAVVTQAKDQAEQSSAVVTRAVAAMGEIQRSSEQIGRIIGMIDEIAFQTNLLALNAGVEAARAGESGRGFAVVAQEVRALAQRSADAAKEIKTLVGTSGAQVAEGVELVSQTGDTLGRIVAEVFRVHGLVAGIAQSAEEQSMGLKQVNTAVNHMDQVTQQNAAMVEETTAATHALLGESRDLSRRIADFRLEPSAASAARAA
jgi:methyl-accepting chemotaxis protein